ncbi:hypothetical protein B0H16DRAFT_1429165 [Mycena metata]|uniref:Uncharacterized protein n=1 Tax=Mycena metata TaxID=1033252 RepID=A0AAD7HTJ8_9AGAR|nr:hypothetical protein B0H16DRAFT_1429165 [Mycena metata]
MLFWIFVFLLTRQSGLTQGHPDLLSRATTEASCDCTVNSCRTLFDIVWGCLATIFACTWVALHQNIPDPKLGWFSRLMRKLRMMLVTIIAPELVVAFAARQFFSALQISQEFKVSKTHGFFCNMGGFVSEEGHPVARVEQLPAYISAIKAIDKEDIKDKSKGDTLSKGVAIAQGLWFVTQCLARVSQHLPLTELEVATLAFAVLSVAIRLLWLHKPLDVQQPIVVSRSEVDIDPLQEEDITPMNNGFSEKINGVIFGDYAEYSPLSSTSVPSFYSIDIGTKNTHLWVIFAGGHPNLLARAPTEASCDCTINSCRTLFNIIWGCLATIFACTWVAGISGDYEEYSPLSSTSVPSFYSIEIGTEDTYALVNLAGVFGVGSIFGSIHCAAWNALFPSMAEMWIWRISSVFIAAYPVLNILLTVAGNTWDHYSNITGTVLAIFLLVALVVYPICRLFLIILSFTTLRSLPPSAFIDVNWSNYIPHL